jgi:uncharacterized membrane protein required for colicin V production
MKNFQFTTFDFILLVVLFVGILRGKKRGISEELLDMLQWIAIVAIAGLFYRIPGPMLANSTGMPIMLSNIICYLVIAGVVTFLFKTIKRAVGEKLIQGDAFGRFEYYLGMLAGAIRFSCILLFVLAILNSYYSTPAERAATAKMQKDNYGSISWPTWPTMQQSVFEDSPSGKFINAKLHHVLIEAVPPLPSRPGENIGKRRERAVNEIIGGGK